MTMVLDAGVAEMSLECDNDAGCRSGGDVSGM